LRDYGAAGTQTSEPHDEFIVRLLLFALESGKSAALYMQLLRSVRVE